MLNELPERSAGVVTAKWLGWRRARDRRTAGDRARCWAVWLRYGSPQAEHE
jgi:hypothetical protein